MGCCGDRRAALRTTAGPAGPLPAGPTARVEYLGRTSVRVRGPASGRVYVFTPSRRALAVDAADVPLLLRARSFRLGR